MILLLPRMCLPSTKQVLCTFGHPVAAGVRITDAAWAQSARSWVLAAATTRGAVELWHVQLPGNPRRSTELLPQEPGAVQGSSSSSRVCVAWSGRGLLAVCGPCGSVQLHSPAQLQHKEEVCLVADDSGAC